jgi:hypothetical protein
MNKLENGHNIKPETAKVSARRKFLVKASATSLVATLPVKASWAVGPVGAGISGNLSGNTSRADVAVVFNGRDPQAWTVAYDIEAETSGGVGLHALLPQSSGIPTKNLRLSAEWSAVFDLNRPPSGVLSGESAPLWQFLPNNLSQLILDTIPGYVPGFVPREIDTHLVAAYLNAVFGFYGEFEGGMSAENYVIGVYDQINFVGGGAVTLVTESRMIEAITSTYGAHY